MLTLRKRPSNHPVKCIILSAAISAGCATAKVPSFRIPDYTAARAVIDRCGEIGTHSAENVVRGITQRLLAGLRARYLNPSPITIRFAACDEPMALSLGEGSLLITRGLVGALPHEAQLSFVLAHEISHVILDHHYTNYEFELESAADLVAIEIMLASGYDVHAAIATFDALSPHLATQNTGSHLAGFQERRRALQGLIEGLKITNRGLSTTRSYTALRRELGY